MVQKRAGLYCQFFLPKGKWCGLGINETCRLCILVPKLQISSIFQFSRALLSYSHPNMIGREHSHLIFESGLVLTGLFFFHSE